MNADTDLAKRIQRLEDVEAIKNLHRKYMFLVNAHEWDEVIDCFTPDGTADIGTHGPHSGKAEMEELFKRKIAGLNEKWNGGHFITQPIISVDGTEASSYWMMYVCVFDAEMATGPVLKWIQGRHDAKYIKIDGDWKLTYLKFTRPWPTPSD